MSVYRRYYSLLCGGMFLYSQGVWGTESIVHWKSDITVHANGMLYSTEYIRVRSTGQAITRGIVRALPTRYQDRYGMWYCTPLSLISVLHNGTPSPYHIEHEDAGIVIIIGESDQLLVPGIHEYQITYTVDRVIGFFTDHDELYWNVTGNGWELPIQQAEVIVRMPEAAAMHQWYLAAYTGEYKSVESSYSVIGQDANMVHLKTQRLLYPYEGFTVVVAFDKGSIRQPSSYDHWCWYIADNRGTFWLLGWLLLLTVWTGMMAYAIWKRNRPGLVVPLFYPPAQMRPSAIGYVTDRSFSNTFLPADIVYLAVQGHLAIECQKCFWGKDQYRISTHYTQEEIVAHGTIQPYEQQLMIVLFEEAVQLFDEKGVCTGRAITIRRTAHDAVRKAVAYVHLTCIKKYSSCFTAFDGLPYGIGGCIGLVVMGFPIFGMLTSIHQIVAIGAAAAVYFSYRIVSRNCYTPDGRALQDLIDGFKLFLSTTELERFALIGTPPTKTPALYEQYLPYAMVLGVEKEWSSHFSSLFDQLAQQGTPYIPRWYVGYTPGMQLTTLLSLVSGMERCMALSSIAPGTVSGLKPSSGTGSGGGYAGGGSGGGGGCGW